MFLGEQFIYILYNYLIIPLSESEDVPNSQNCLKEKDECEKCYTRRNAIQQMMKVRIKVLSPPELSAQCSSTLMHNMHVCRAHFSFFQTFISEERQMSKSDLLME